MPATSLSGDCFCRSCEKPFFAVELTPLLEQFLEPRLPKSLSPFLEVRKLGELSLGRVNAAARGMALQGLECTVRGVQTALAQSRLCSG